MEVADYAELHAHSAFSFLDGASQPEEMAAEAGRLGLSALAITDHDGLYGIVRYGRIDPGTRSGRISLGQAQTSQQREAGDG